MDQSVVVNSSPGSGQTRKRQNQDPAGGALKDMARPNNDAEAGPSDLLEAPETDDDMAADRNRSSVSERGPKSESPSAHRSSRSGSGDASLLDGGKRDGAAGSRPPSTAVPPATARETRSSGARNLAPDVNDLNRLLFDEVLPRLKTYHDAAIKRKEAELAEAEATYDRELQELRAANREAEAKARRLGEALATFSRNQRELEELIERIKDKLNEQASITYRVVLDLIKLVPSKHGAASDVGEPRLAQAGAFSNHGGGLDSHVGQDMPASGAPDSGGPTDRRGSSSSTIVDGQVDAPPSHRQLGVVTRSAARRSVGNLSAGPDQHGAAGGTSAAE